MTATRIKPVEAAAREMHAYALEHDPELGAWEDIDADVRDRYLTVAKRMVKAWKKAKASV